ncbi:MAG: M23 family metallopeptidase [Chloroflexota bacterium]
MTDVVYVLNDDLQHFAIYYFDYGDPLKRTALQEEWLTFTRVDPLSQQPYNIWARPSNDTMDVAVDHSLPPSTPAGRYRIETFIPGKHATTRKAIFTICHKVHNSYQLEQHLDEILVIVDMHDLYDVWHPLGEFDLDPAQHPLIGRVRQYDLTREDPPTEISFGPVRWVPVTALPGDSPRFDSPVGTPEEREAAFPTGMARYSKYPVWAGEWFDVNPFLNWYSYGYHTGADLNLPGISSADQGKPVYAIGDGLVTYAGRAGSWGYIIVIQHPQALVTLPGGETSRQIVYSRYGHVDPDILARAGQAVERGQHIGYIGLAAGAKSGWHLHFDISYTDILKRMPAHWPDLSALRSGRGGNQSDKIRSSILRQVVSNYVDPLRFIQTNHNPG